MFLFPWSGMIGGVFYEHSHRLIGAVVGLLTVALAAALWPRGGRLRTLGLVAVAAVIVQGVLGGLRVVLLHDQLAIVHGCLAQAFWALVVALAILTWPGAGAAVAAPAPRGLAFAAVLVVYMQIVFGALLTHEGWIWLHLGGAVAVFAVVPILTARARRLDDPLTMRATRALLVLLGLQLALGAGSFVARFSSVWIPGEQLTMLALPVAHRLAGSLILAATVAVAVRVATGTAHARVAAVRLAAHAGVGGAR
jgi:cytochrome c oxidase assembly protein subunit 15